MSPPLPRRCGPSLQPVCGHPCCLRRLLSGSTTGFFLNLNEACSAFTHVATRSLAHQPCADLVGRLQHVDYSSCCYSARRLLAFTAAGLPSTNVRVTLWITTAIHLDTPTIQTSPRIALPSEDSRLSRSRKISSACVMSSLC